MSIFIIRDPYNEIYVGYTQSKKILKKFMSMREPDLYDWVEITDKKYIKALIDSCEINELTDIGGIPATITEQYDFHDFMICSHSILQTCLEKIILCIKYMKLSDDELDCIMVAIKDIINIITYNDDEYYREHIDAFDDAYMFMKFLRIYSIHKYPF